MTHFNPITFTLATDNKKAVVADRYVAHELYVRNEAIIKDLGGTIIKGVGGFRAEFKSKANAEKFISKAITKLSNKEYNATRKVQESDEGNKKSTKSGKGNKNAEMVTLTDEKGNKYTIPKSALAQTQESKKPARKSKGSDAPTKTPTKVEEAKKPAHKSKGDVELTEAGKKALVTMKTSVLNRAASAYSIAHGGEATTFKVLGKSEKELKDFIPNAKAGLLKSSKWAKASATHGLTEEML